MADFVVFGEDWGGLPSSTQHLITHLMKRHRVIWVNSIGMRSPKLRLRDIARAYNKVTAMFQPRQHSYAADTAPRPYIIEPKVIPFHGIKMVRAINKFLLRRSITALIKEHDFKEITLWTSLPTAVDIVGSLGEKNAIYYCGDDFEGLDGVDHHTIQPMEQELASKVDLILVVNQELANKFPDSNTHILPHGVDYNLFSTPKSRPMDLPDNGPIVGFYGSISAWLNVDMLDQSATAMPKWQFVLIGDIKTDVSTLEKLPNVHFLGPKPHAQLPAYVQHWDVAMLPFRHNRQIEACNPLKLREYLASGTPVAATAFPAIEPYRDYVSIQQGKEPFFSVLQKANKQAGLADARQKAVAPESWENRVAQLEALIDQLNQKQPETTTTLISNQA